jgi:hypothetical protein
VLISDLYEGGVEPQLLRRVASLVESGVQCVPSFACTSNALPGLIAAAIRRDDIVAWATGQGIVTAVKGG